MNRELTVGHLKCHGGCTRVCNSPERVHQQTLQDRAEAGEGLQDRVWGAGAPGQGGRWGAPGRGARWAGGSRTGRGGEGGRRLQDRVGGWGLQDRVGGEGGGGSRKGRGGGRGTACDRAAQGVNAGAWAFTTTFLDKYLKFFTIEYGEKITAPGSCGTHRLAATSSDVPHVGPRLSLPITPEPASPFHQEGRQVHLPGGPRPSRPGLKV